MNTHAAPSADRSRGDSSLTARLAIELDPAASCAMLEAGPTGESITRNDVNQCRNSRDEVECRAEVTLTADGARTRRFIGSAIDEYCICPAFRSNECVVDIRSFRDRTMFVAVTVPNRDVLRDVIGGLRSKGAVVTLESILPLQDRRDGSRTFELDASRVTEKQREAIVTAIELGYYDSPRRTDLADLAARLGVSQSAVSQRLNSAESTLVQELYSAGGSA